MPGKETVFISYRRSDSAAQAQQLRDQLAGLLHDEAVFFDKGMRTGTDFPNEIKQAVARVRLMLVLIDPAWLQAMIDRAANTAKTDWVFEEIKAALSRLPSADDLIVTPIDFIVMPILLPGATMPGEGSLPAALSELWRLNAAHLKLHAAALPPDTDALLKLLHHAGLVRYEARNDLATLTALGVRLKALLDLPPMEAIRAGWRDPPCTPSEGTDIPDAIAKLNSAIRGCDFLLNKLDAKDKATTQAICQSLLTLLCNMASDFALAEHWRSSDGQWIVPSGSAGHAVNMLASTFNAKTEAIHPPVQLTPGLGGNELHPKYANVIDSGVPGIGVDQAAHLHAALWIKLRTLPVGDLLGMDYPVDQKVALVPGDRHFEALKRAVEAARMLDCPVITAHELTAGLPSIWQHRQDAAAVGLPYLPYRQEGLSLTRCPPDLLHSLRRACQHAINQILAT